MQICVQSKAQVMPGILAPAPVALQRWEDQNGAPVGVCGQAVVLLASSPEGIDLHRHLLCTGENLEEQGHKEAREIQSQYLWALGQVNDLPQCSSCLHKPKQPETMLSTETCLWQDPAMGGWSSGLALGQGRHSSI